MAHLLWLCEWALPEHLYTMWLISFECRRSGCFMRAAALCFQQLFNSHKLDIVPLQGVTNFSQAHTFYQLPLHMKAIFHREPSNHSRYVYIKIPHTTLSCYWDMYYREFIGSKFHCGGNAVVGEQGHVRSSGIIYNRI